MPWVDLWSVTVAFPGHYSLALKIGGGGYIGFVLSVITFVRHNFSFSLNILRNTL